MHSMTIKIHGLVLAFALPASGVLADSVQTQPASKQGIRLQTGAHPTFINAAGQPFIAKGVIYYQPRASHHYFLRELDLKRVPDDLRQLKDVGFNTVGIEVPWGELFAEVDPANGYAPVRIHQNHVLKLVKLAERVGEAGMYMNVLPLQSCVPPEVPAVVYEATVDDAGHHHPAFKGYRVIDWLVDEDINEGFLTYLRFLGETLAPFDHILAYGLTHELMEHNFPTCREDDTLLAAWRRYLRDRNADVSYWKQRWDEPDAEYEAIDDIPFPYHDWDLWSEYYQQKGVEPRESSAIAWRDYFDFAWVEIAGTGQYGMSFADITAAIRSGDPDALISWKAHDPARYAWEIGCLEQWEAGNTPPDAARIMKSLYGYQGIDILAMAGYPTTSAGEKERAIELTFERQLAHATRLLRVADRPVYVQEFGMSHHEWLQEERVTYFTNAIRAYQKLPLVGYTIWQSIDYIGGGIWGGVQPKFGLFDLEGNPYPVVDAIRPLLQK